MAAHLGLGAASSNTSTPSSPIPSYPAGAMGIFPVQRRSGFYASPTRRRIHNNHFSRRNDATQLPLDPASRAIAKGYSDGYETAKIFALYGMSKLGFTGQYIKDSLKLLGNKVIVPEQKHYYVQSFMEGLRDGETLVTSSVG